MSDCYPPDEARRLIRPKTTRMNGKIKPNAAMTEIAETVVGKMIPLNIVMSSPTKSSTAVIPADSPAGKVVSLLTSYKKEPWGWGQESNLSRLGTIQACDQHTSALVCCLIVMCQHSD